MSYTSETKVTLDSKNISNYKSISISQEIAKHHYVELVVDRNVLEDTKSSFESKKYLGKSISISLITRHNDKTIKGAQFKGIITQIKNIKASSEGRLDEIIFIANSPTIILDDGPNHRSYLDISPVELLDKMTKENSSVNFEHDINPIYKDRIAYSVQHGESSFQYANRIASQYGEWFYYDGTKLIFGKPGTEKTQLTINNDLLEFSKTLIPISGNYKFFINDYNDNKTHDVKTESLDSISQEEIRFVSKIASELYNKETTVHKNTGGTQKLKKSLEDSALIQKKSIEINQIKVSGTSINPKLTLGNIITIDGEEYRLTKLIHQDIKHGQYSNHFTAIPADKNAYPLTNINSFPTSQTESAIVMQNNDPDDMGRITVQFSWQKEQDTETPWIRTTSPHAGGDNGFHFIPEIGEEVLIGFEGGNAERPFVIGSLYNGSAKTKEDWNSKNNDFKVIRTRSGHSIKFDDTEGKESITISDKNKNIILIDTANSSISISAPENIDINANKINLNAKEINMIAEENINIDAKKEFSQSSGTKTNINSGSDININAASKTNIKSDAKINIESEVTELKGKSALSIKGDKIIDINAAISTNIKGGTLNLNC